MEVQKVDSDRKLIALCRKLGLPPSYLDHKSHKCPHSQGCLLNILKTTITSFKYGFLLRGAISLLGALVQFKAGKRDPKILLQALVGKENWVFASFLALFPLVNKTLLCLMRNYTGKNCGTQDFLSGAIAGSVSVSILPPSLRFILTLYLMTRALEALYRHRLMKKGLQVRKHDYVILFAVCCGLIGYAFAHEPDLMPASLVKIYLRFANMSPNDVIFREGWIEMTKRKLALPK